MFQIIALYTLNVHDVIYQLYFKAEENIKKLLKYIASRFSY